jgi:hypothetical protein
MTDSSINPLPDPSSFHCSQRRLQPDSEANQSRSLIDEKSLVANIFILKENLILMKLYNFDGTTLILHLRVLAMLFIYCAV